jgi:hypothetical protein
MVIEEHMIGFIPDQALTELGPAIMEGSNGCLV